MKNQLVRRSNSLTKIQSMNWDMFFNKYTCYSYKIFLWSRKVIKNEINLEPVYMNVLDIIYQWTDTNTRESNDCLMSLKAFINIPYKILLGYYAAKKRFKNNHMINALIGRNFHIQFYYVTNLLMLHSYYKQLSKQMVWNNLGYCW